MDIHEIKLLLESMEQSNPPKMGMNQLRVLCKEIAEDIEMLALLKPDPTSFLPEPTAEKRQKVVDRIRNNLDLIVDYWTAIR